MLHYVSRPRSLSPSLVCLNLLSQRQSLIKTTESFTYATDTMLLILLIVGTFAAVGAQAAPRAQNMTPCENSSIATTNLFTAPATTPTVAYSVFGYRQGNEIVHQYWNAARQRFYLGGVPASYCPEAVQSESGCPPGNATAFVGLISLVCC
jgi:hypothetical protein